MLRDGVLSIRVVVVVVLLLETGGGEELLLLLVLSFGTRGRRPDLHFGPDSEMIVHIWAGPARGLLSSTGEDGVTVGGAVVATLSSSLSVDGGVDGSGLVGGGSGTSRLSKL